MAGERRRRAWTGWGLGLLAVLILLWCGYWYVAREFAEGALDRASAGPIDGQRITCTGEQLGGFPLRLNFACDRAAYSKDGDLLTAALGGLRATAPLYRPGVVRATLDSPFVANAPAQSIALTGEWTSGSADVNVGLSGVRGFGGTFTGLAVENNASGADIPIVAATASTATLDVRRAGGGSYQIAVTADDLVLSLARGDSLPEIDATARATAIDVGGSLGTNPAQTLLEWLRDGGTVTIERMTIGATGATLDAEGSLTISDDGVVSGALTLRFVDLQAFADLVEAIRPGSRERVSQALAALTAFTVPVETEDGPARQTSLVITDGLVSVGIIPVGVIPAIRF